MQLHDDGYVRIPLDISTEDARALAIIQLECMYADKRQLKYFKSAALKYGSNMGPGEIALWERHGRAELYPCHNANLLGRRDMHLFRFDLSKREDLDKITDFITRHDCWDVATPHGVYLEGYPAIGDRPL